MQVANTIKEMLNRMVFCDANLKCSKEFVWNGIHGGRGSRQRYSHVIV